MNYFVGIDIGTTHTKAVVVTEEGKTFFETKKGYELIRPDAGYEEQDPEIILKAVVDVLTQAGSSVSPGERIIAVSFSAAMHSIFPVDKNGLALYNAITWADTRSTEESRSIADGEYGATIYQNTGIPIHPMSPLCKIAWFKNNRPEIFANTHKFISIKEFVFNRLFGVYLVDYSIASATGLFNTVERKWDPVALQAAGIHESKLSEPISTTYNKFKLTAAFRTVLGAQEETIFVAGASDGCMANFGSGAVVHGETALTIGTSGAVRMTVHQSQEKLRTGSEEKLFSYPMTEELYVRGGAINNGGIILKWLGDLFLSADPSAGNDYESILSLAQQSPAGADGLLFLPYLLGERAPVWDADAKGVLVGLTMKHKKEQVIRAAIEGMCFTLRQLINKLELVNGGVKEIYVSGGFVQSSFWVQLIADITGKRLNVTEMADASGMGSAYLAMHATGYLDDLTIIKKFTPVSAVYEPVKTNHENYSTLFNLFDSLYPKLKDDFAALSRLQKN